MNTLYYIELDGQQYGAYTLEQVKQFGVFADTLVLAEGGEEWKSAREYPELLGCYQENTITADTLDIFNINYYYKDENEQLYGPLSIVELAYLDINESTPLGINSTENWHYASEIENLTNMLVRLAELDKEEYDAEMQKIRADYTRQLEEQLHKTQEIELDKQELKEVIEEQEKELVEREQEIERLKNPPKPKDILTKKMLFDAISEFKDKLQTEECCRFSISYPSLSNELLDNIEKYNDLQKQFINLLNFLSKKSQLWLCASEKDYRLKNEVMSAVRNITEQYYKTNAVLFPENYETAEATHTVWNSLQTQKHNFPTSTLLIGKNVIDFALFDELFCVTKYEYATLLDTKNIVAYYDKSTRQQSFDFINTLTARLFMSSLPGKFSVTTIDTLEMEGVSDLFKSLNKSVFIYSREQEIEQCFRNKTQYVENVIQNLLLHPVKNIGEYNQGKENPEGYQLLIIKAFPVGLRENTLSLLKQIMKNGQRAGIHIILLIDEDELSASESAQKQFEVFELDKFNSTTIQFDFTTAKFPFSDNTNIHNFYFENLNTSQIQNVVRHINKSLETKPAEVVSFANYIPQQSEWWNFNSANRIDIPFGVSEDKELISLAITQENGQNSAMVLGIPGSGKSVFLHTIITNAAIHYSPDELELYLIDFSGVEFNAYANHSLPQARVIAPESEREFGISILRKIKEEGSRRMDICREADVQNIVDYREQNPNVHLPRIVLIVDEFQKFFEIQNDKISDEALDIIKIIIKEYRKFGINILLATQTLSDNPVKMDMIANRLAFKCAPNDVYALFGSNDPTTEITRAGECIYNASSGTPSDNRKVQTFFIQKKERDLLLEKIKDFASYKHKSAKDVIVFRSDAPALIDKNIQLKKTEKSDFPNKINVWLGEPIELSDTDVYFPLQKDSRANVLIIGGEAEVAERIAINCAQSLIAAHNPDSAKFSFFNFIRQEDTLHNKPNELYNDIPFDRAFPFEDEVVVSNMETIKEEVEKRLADKKIPQQPIYLSFYAFQLANIFRRKGGNYDDMTDAAQLLSFILQNGPLVGLFTILQVDNLQNLKRALDNPLDEFMHRIVLQMDETSSMDITGSYIANKIEVLNRKSSRNRAYYYNPNSNNVFNKFKPYELCKQ